MADQTLTEFVRDALAKGASRADIEAALTQADWPPEQVRAALASFADAPFVVPVPLRRPYVSAREAFLYLVLFIALGVFTTHLGALGFALVNLLIPADAGNAWEVRAAGSTIRWAISALAVALPLFLVLTWRLGRARRSNPAMQDSRIRKWLTYLTLVVAASVLIGDLIAVIYNLLSGELTTRFLLKAAIIGVIAAGVFIHYIPDAERDDSRSGRFDLALGGVVVAVALAAVVTGVTLIDSPGTLRARSLDSTRLDAITEIAGAMDCYWTYEEKLPESLDAMRTALSDRASSTTVGYACSWSDAVDPATGAPYEYRPLDGARYEICATFSRESDPDNPETRQYSYQAMGGYRVLNAEHGAGLHCFTLEAVSLEPPLDEVIIRDSTRSQSPPG